jgi:hypothetical protein
MWLDPNEFEVEVKEGVVRLHGTVDRRSVKEILLELVERVDGVVSVEDRVRHEWDDRSAKPGPPESALRWSENWVAR